jgi:hypothetical protein
MKPSSKFERMKLKPSDKMKMAKSATSAGAPQPAGMAKPMNPKLAARKKAMQKMAGGYGK